MKVAVVMPCYGSLNWIDGAVRSLWDGRGGLDLELILVNNGDAETREWFKVNQHIVAIDNETNLGISAAWNQGVARALSGAAELIVLANSDIVCSKWWGDALLEGARRYPHFYFLANGCKHEEFDVPAPPEAVRGRAGWFVALPRRLAEEVGSVPENLFLWYGDDYIHESAADRGWQAAILPRMRVFHQGSISVFRLPNYTDRIEADRVEWRRICDEKGWGPPVLSREAYLRRVSALVSKSMESLADGMVLTVLDAMAFEMRRLR